ncbi:MAG: DoxX family protein [Firmicutes bacterium]|nr:DoxX family protein [Bacillota bacterium]
MKKWLLSPWLTVRFQILLGMVFVVAALPKIADPPGFARMVYAYKLFPDWSLFLIAIFLPWLELLAGALLTLGLWVRATTAWLAVLLLGFVMALSINLARRHPVDCGCFGTHAPPKTQQERLNDMGWILLRDLGLLLVAAQILVASRKEKLG